MILKYYEKKNIMHKKFFQIITTAVAIAGAEGHVMASDWVSRIDAEERAKVVQTQLSMQMQLNRLTGEDHATFYKAIMAATDEQCVQVAHQKNWARETLLDFNASANDAKHNLAHKNYFDELLPDDRSASEIADEKYGDHDAWNNSIE